MHFRRLYILKSEWTSHAKYHSLPRQHIFANWQLKILTSSRKFRTVEQRALSFIDNFRDLGSALIEHNEASMVSNHAFLAVHLLLVLKFIV